MAAVKAALRIPVVANGDIDSPQRAAAVLAATGADAVMIGRAAQGRPWIFREIAHYLADRRAGAAARSCEARDWLLEHLDDHYSLYGEFAGVRTARKHIGWAVRGLPGGDALRARMNLLESSAEQVRLLSELVRRGWPNEHAELAGARRQVAPPTIRLRTVLPTTRLEAPTRFPTHEQARNRSRTASATTSRPISRTSTASSRPRCTR